MRFIKHHIYLFSIIIGLKIVPSIGFSQLYYPNQSDYNQNIESYTLTDTLDVRHFSVKPYINIKTNTQINPKTDSSKSWIKRKLFDEHFIIFKGSDYFCYVDPILDFQMGVNTQNSSERYYWNSRGIRVQAQFLNRVAFSTTFYENQAVLPQYQSAFIDSHGEFRVSTNGYLMSNGFVPGYARTKPFKTNGYDFSLAEGYVSILASHWLNIQFGNGNQFIGNGYRSLFLSDFSSNYPYLKTEWTFLEDKLQYNLIYSILTNPYRLTSFSTVESTYEKKYGTFQHLDYALSQHWSVGLFEGSTWRHTDSLGYHSPFLATFNPILGVNSLLYGTEQESAYNSVFGLSVNYYHTHFQLYHQSLIDNGQAAFQLGFKSYHLLIKGLFVRLELNHSPLNTYLTSNSRYNYSNNNLSLAHPLTAGFTEGICILNYQKNRWFIESKSVFYQKLDGAGTDILDEKQVFNNVTTYHVYHQQLEIGYRFNWAYNLQMFGGGIYRQSTSLVNPHTQYIYFGIRTAIKNKTIDW